MDKFYFLKKGILSVLISAGSYTFAQVQLNQLTEFGTSIYDINNDGKGIHGNGYYDFMTNTSSTPESEVGQTAAINNAGQVIGLIDDGTGNFVPGYRNEGVWTSFPETAFDPEVSYIIYDISENGVYVVGQTAWTPENGAWGFIYNTQTETFKLLSSDLYEYGAAYAVNDNGIAVGWVDDLESGTLRMPAYFYEDGMITLIRESAGEAHGINQNNEIVGSYEGQPFIYKIESNEFTPYTFPEGYLNASFSDISDNGIAVGYTETYIEGQGFARFPIIFHTSFGEEVQMLAEYLNSFGVDTSDLDGQGYKISPDGNYIAGWTSGVAFMALGWAVYLDDAVLGISDLTSSDFSYYPNPAKDILNLNTNRPIQNVSIYNLAGQQVTQKTTISNNQINISSLTSGVYVLHVTLDKGETKTFKIIKR